MTPELSALLQRQIATLREHMPVAAAVLDAAPEARRDAAARVLLGSDFVARSLGVRDALLQGLLEDGSLDLPRSLADYQRLLAELTAACEGDEPAYMAGLRRLRQREYVRIAWRDLAGDADVEQTLRETSWFAEAAIDAASRFAGAQLARRHGMPEGADAGLIVLGMGKLGGGELNFSSDIDLIFLFAEGGETTGAAPIAYEEFYTRQGRLLIRLLDAATEDGFVFRVDMRLRPFGDSGPLVTSFAALEDYLQVHGRDWERYAYVKARALPGQHRYAALRESVMRPFVYRRYLDFGVFDALREMKGLIAREVERRELADHVKLGPGGIREIEFIVQAFQLIRGGQDRSLRETSLLTVLPRLRGAKLLPVQVVEELTQAYLFLRRLENRLQMLGDCQTHTIPADSLEVQRIAAGLGYPNARALHEALDAHRARVTRHFDAVVVAPAGERASTPLDLAALWEPGYDRAPMLERLQALGIAEPEEVLRLLEGLRERVRRLDEIGRRRLDALLRCVVCELPREDSIPVLRRVLLIIEAIGQRSAYFALLLENTAARRRLLQVCAHGNFLASRIAAHPLLLDELIDDRVLERLPDRDALAEDLALRVAEVSGEEPDHQVEALCRFQRAAIFRVALADLSGRLPVMQVSDRLTEIAELIVDEAIRMAWLQITGLLGIPRCIAEAGASPRIVRVAAIGYGKLGGRELGYTSDLDLVFLHDSVGEEQETDSSPPVDNQVFFLRFAQRLMHLLTVHSAAGRLYEVDVRLRPSGKGGLLVTSVPAFREYQFAEAWTWEHQALLHARAVAGDTELKRRIEALRMDVLMNAVRRTDLRVQIRDMRERMRRELSAARDGQFDLKQDRGGIADIEFLAQYWALKWAQAYPPVAMFSDTIRQLESVASAALVPQETVDELVQAYQLYRLRGHHRSLDGLDNLLEAGEFAPQRRAVAAIWEATMQGEEGI